MQRVELTEIMKNDSWQRMLVVAFAVWTALTQIVDVQPVGQNGTSIGFSTFNCWFHNLTGVHMSIYTITDWMGLVPIFICLIFAGVGLVQLIKRKSLFKLIIKDEFIKYLNTPGIKEGLANGEPRTKKRLEA